MRRSFIGLSTIGAIALLVFALRPGGPGREEGGKAEEGPIRAGQGFQIPKEWNPDRKMGYEHPLNEEYFNELFSSFTNTELPEISEFRGYYNRTEETLTEVFYFTLSKAEALALQQKVAGSWKGFTRRSYPELGTLTQEELEDRGILNVEGIRNAVGQRDYGPYFLFGPTTTDIGQEVKKGDMRVEFKLPRQEKRSFIYYVSPETGQARFWHLLRYAG